MSARDRQPGRDFFDSRISGWMSATVDDSDPGIEGIVPEVLKLVREHLGMEVAFVSQFLEGQRIFRFVDPADGQQKVTVGTSDPLALSFCQRVVDGQLPELVHDVAKLRDFPLLPRTPFPIGAHLSTPIVLANGEVYGTLCCFSEQPDASLTERDLKRLRMAAAMVARLVDKARKLDKG